MVSPAAFQLDSITHLPLNQKKKDIFSPKERRVYMIHGFLWLFKDHLPIQIIIIIIIITHALYQGRHPNQNQ